MTFKKRLNERFREKLNNKCDPSYLSYLIIYILK